MDYIIAIPSYKRATALKTHTLKVLNDVPKEKIFIFVANDEEHEEYKTILPEYNIIVGLEGLLNQRNYISHYFPLGTKIVSMDDDIQGIFNKEFEEVDIESIILKGFEECDKSGSRIWAVYPVLNKLFMKNTITTDFRFLVGNFFGYINSNIDTTITEKDDYERSILYYLRDNIIIRFNYISIKTKYYKMQGGLQSNKDRMKDQLIAVNYLLEKYPTFLARKKSFKSGYPELRCIKQK